MSYSAVALVCLVVALIAPGPASSVVIQSRPNTTDTSVRICATNDNGNQKQACGVHELWCTQRSYGNQGSVSGQCAPCLTSYTGYPARLVSADQTNLCNCPVGQYCRQITNYNNAGVCVPYTHLGKPCGTDADCVSAIGHAWSSLDPSDQNTQEGRLFCYYGTCTECQPDAWEAGTTTVPNLSRLGQPYLCPGIDMPMSATLGFYYYLSNRPGETRTCLANGTLVSGGAINYNLVTTAAATTTTTAATTTTATTTTADAASEGAIFIVGMWMLVCTFMLALASAL